MDIIIGSVASGKTTKLMKVVSEHTKNNKQVLLLSGEDTLESLAEKLTSLDSILENVIVKPFQTFDKVVSEVLSDNNAKIVCIDNIQLATTETKNWN